MQAARSSGSGTRFCGGLHLTMLQIYTLSLIHIYKAAAKGVISKNAANREKARMARELAKAE